MAHAMLKFCNTADTLAEVRAILKQADEAILAVAFWGEGAIKRLGLDQARPEKLTLVGDLESGACNPNEIDRLWQITGLKIFSKAKLHAKVFWTEKAVLIGSANVSANGLGFEGGETDTNIEAGLLTDDVEVTRSVKLWLDNTVLKGARPIDEKLLAECKTAWELRRKSRHDLTRYRVGENERTILDLLRSEPEALKELGVHFWISKFWERPENSEKALQNQKEQRRYSHLECWFLYDKLDHVSPGDYIIEFAHNSGSRNTNSNGEIWRVELSDPWEGVDRGYNLYCRRVRSIAGFSDRGLKGELKRFVQRRLEGNPDFEGTIDLLKVSREMGRR